LIILIILGEECESCRSRYFILLQYKYFSQHPVLKHPQSACIMHLGKEQYS
jgi:hypothetical protein